MVNTPRWGNLLIAGATFLFLGAIASAQAVDSRMGRVNGTVRDSFGYPVVGAQILISGTSVHGETDERGSFALAIVMPGSLTIQVRRIGFRSDTSSLTVLEGQSIAIEIVLSRYAVDLQAVLVLGRRQLTGGIAGFYDRRSRGIGHFYTRAEIEKRNPQNLTDVLSTSPGIRLQLRGSFDRVVRIRGSQCFPLTWLDGVPMLAGEVDLDAFDPRSFEGVEVYFGPASVPAEFLGSRSASSSCGTIVLWSRQGELRPKRRRNGEPSAAAEIERLVEENTVFTALQVDVPARADRGSVVRPIYPDSLFDHGIPGKVLAEFVVSTEGEVIMETFSIVTASHDAFGEAVRGVMRMQRYSPAQRRGRAVQQVVQQPFEFVPDSTAIRKK